MNNILQTHPIKGINFVRAEGYKLWDDSGKAYIDLESGTWSAILGQKQSEINQTISRQTEAIMHLGVLYPNSTTQAAAEKVLEILNMKDGKCLFLSSGSEAVDLSVTIAKALTGSEKCLTFSSSYLSAAHLNLKDKSSGWEFLNWRELAEDFTSVEDLIDFSQTKVFVFEAGGSGSEAVEFPPARLVKAIAECIHANGGLIVSNEITTGFGRTGKWFGYQHYNIDPDIVALGKGLGNGYPVSAVAVKNLLAERVAEIGLHHAQSHQNDPLGCAVASQVISILQRDQLIEKAEAKGAHFLQKLKALEHYECVKEARGRGMLLAVEFHPNQQFSMQQLFDAILDEGFVVACSLAKNFLRLDPPLILEQCDVDAFVSTLEKVILNLITD